MALENKLSADEFHPAYGETKPHLSHEEMQKFGPREHGRLEKEHQRHGMDASKKAHDARRAGDKEQEKAHRELSFKHDGMARMHGMYALSRTGKEDIRPGALNAAKKRHEELSGA